MLTRFHLVLERLYHVLVTVFSEHLLPLSLLFLFLGYVAHLKLLIKWNSFPLDAADMRPQG